MEGHFLSLNLHVNDKTFFLPNFANSMLIASEVYLCVQFSAVVFVFSVFICFTVNVIKFMTKIHEETVKALIRLVLKEQFDQGRQIFCGSKI